MRGAISNDRPYRDLIEAGLLTSIGFSEAMRDWDGSLKRRRVSFSATPRLDGCRYSRDEFHYVGKQYNGDASLVADATFPDPKGYDGRKVVLIIRQNLANDSKEAMIGEDGSGMIYVAQRPKSGAMATDMQYRFGGSLEGDVAAVNGCLRDLLSWHAVCARRIPNPQRLKRNAYGVHPQEIVAPKRSAAGTQGCSRSSEG